jgi:chaperone required for assembly of F1-ATPase
VLEGELIFSLANASEDPAYSPDIVEYIALSLLHEGFVVAPDLLEFADEQLLLHLSDEGQALRPLVQKAWKALTDDALEELSFPESAEGVQLARLAAVQVYCDNQARTLLEALP